MIMACLYGICEYKQHELYDMKHDKLCGIITPIGICIKCELKNENDMKHGTWQGGYDH